MGYSKRLLVRKLTFIVVPLLTSPLLFFSKEYKCLYVILVMCAYWVTECIPAGVTSLVPLFLFPVLEIMEAKEVSKAYFMDTTVLGIASLLMGNAVEEVHLHKRIALGMLKVIGYRKHLLLLSTIVVTGFISMCIADMAACVMMLPIILAILRILQEVQKKSPQTLPTIYEDISMEEASNFEGINGNLSYNKASSKENKSAIEKSLNLNTMSKADRGFAKAVVMACATASLFGGKGTLTGSTSNIAFREQFGLEEPVTYLQWASFSIPFMMLGLICNYLVLVIVFMLPTACSNNEEGMKWKQKKQLRELTRVKIQEEYDSLGRFSFAEGSVMVWFTLLIIAWMSRNPGFIPGWGSLLSNESGITDGTVAIIVVIFIFYWPKNPRNDQTLEPILKWDVMKTTFSWSCVLLVAVGNAISEGVKKSGLSKMIGCFLRGALAQLSPFWLQVLAQLSASIVSEFTSNTSTAGIFAPIMFSIAQAFNMNPLYLVLPATFASSWGFMMPTATPANAIVYDTGMLSLWEMCLAGFILKLVAIVITALNFETLAYKILSLDEPLLFQSINVTGIDCG